MLACLRAYGSLEHGEIYTRHVNMWQLPPQYIHSGAITDNKHDGPSMTS